jgi:hypothetical protein
MHGGRLVIDSPRDGIVEDCVGEILERAHVVYQTAIRVEESIASDIGTGFPDCGEER